MNIKKACIAYIMLAITLGCHAAGAVDGRQPEPPARLGFIGQAKLSEGSVMQFLFGSPGADGRWTWRAAGESSQAANRAGQVRLSLLAPYSEGSTDKTVAVVELRSTAAAPTPPEQAIIGVFVFSRTSSRWMLETYNSEVIAAGSYGTVSHSSLVSIGDGKYGLRFDTGYSNMGQTSGGMFLVDISRAIPTLMLQEIKISGENGGVCETPAECYEFDSDINFVESTSGSPYQDLLIITHGTRPTASFSKIIDASHKDRYIYTCNGYVLMDKDMGSITHATKSCDSKTRSNLASWDARHYGALQAAHPH